MQLVFFPKTSRRVFLQQQLKSSVKHCSDFRTTSLINHASKVLLMIKNIIFDYMKKVLAESEGAIQYMVNKSCDTCATYRMSLNAKKTKVM